MDHRGDKIGVRATNQRASYIAGWLLLCALTLTTLYLACVSLGCGPVHFHIGTRHYCGSGVPASQPAYIGSSNPEIILGAE